MENKNENKTSSLEEKNTNQKKKNTNPENLTNQTKRKTTIDKEIFKEKDNNKHSVPVASNNNNKQQGMNYNNQSAMQGYYLQNSQDYAAAAAAMSQRRDNQSLPQSSYQAQAKADSGYSSLPEQQAQQSQIPKTYEQHLLERGYKLGRTLGSGSYAKVKETDFYSPRFTEPKKMAVKIIDKKRAPRDFLQKFLPRELDIYLKIEHDNIIKIFDILELGNKVFIFMEIAEGGDLLDYIKTNGALSNSLAKRMFHELCQAVRYIHSKQITHRDLKCENLLLDRENHIKLADFGFARRCIDEKTNKRILSETYCGSAAYAAPEILKGQPYNPKLYDIWSLGVILFIMVCGSMPYDDKDVQKMLETQLKAKVKFPSRILDRLDTNVRDLIHSMLEVDVTKRYNIDKVLKHFWLSEEVRANNITNQTNNRIIPEQSTIRAQQEQRIISPNNYTRLVRPPSLHRRTQ